MATVLAYTSPAIGHLFPTVPLLLELRDRGHDVHVRTLGDHVGMLRDLGLAAEPIDPRVGRVLPSDFRAGNARAALRSAVQTFTERAALDGPDLDRALTEVAPDAVVVDINAWGALLAAEAWGRPWATFSPYTPPIRSAGTPPFGPGLLPSPGLLGRARDAVVRPLVIGTTEKAMTPRINTLRAERGLGPISTADEFFRRAPVMLVATAEPFEYAHPDWGERVRMIGAMSWEPPAERPGWLDELEGDVVLVTTSSEYQADEALVRSALEGLADEPYTVVATMPARASARTAVPANAHVVDFVPHGPVLERAAVAVTHGGMGSTQKALARGVPVCVVPFGRDQLEVAARVVTSDSGTRLPAARLTPERLRAKVREAATKTAGARRVAHGYAAAGGPAAGATAVEELLRPARV
ncbi:glycosyltransferase [Georgenia subflava]|uniref:Glycosyltransferase n=1 Tax=Georgenia subflava TaxID=1622177 RepID=A0A6N7EHJ4_9MICO|nr:glycosyltransferase [Georgenia subflava]MPV36891.1 glycosyltransferase [Georgenia subflava]